jgi:hypothetical protein
MRGKEIEREIQYVVDSDWDLWHSEGYEKHDSQETAFENGDVLEVPSQKPINLGLDYEIRNLHTPILAPNWVIGVTVWNVTDNKRAGSTKNIIPALPGGVSNGTGRDYVSVGAITKPITFRIKLWANQNETDNPSDIPDASWK